MSLFDDIKSRVTNLVLFGVWGDMQYPVCALVKEIARHVKYNICGDKHTSPLLALRAHSNLWYKDQTEHQRMF